MLPIFWLLPIQEYSDTIVRLILQKKKSLRSGSRKKGKNHHSSVQEKSETRKVDDNMKEIRNRQKRAKDKDGSNLNYQFGKYGVIREVRQHFIRLNYVRRSSPHCNTTS